MRKLLIFFGAALLVMLLSMGSTYLVYSRLNADPASAKLEKVDRQMLSLTLERITTNLADPGMTRFIQVGLEVWVSDDRTQRYFQENLAEVRDRLIGVLRSKTSADLQGAEGMERLSSEMAAALKAVYPEGSVQAVHFTEFLIQ